MLHFITNWAQSLLDIFRARETDPNLGKPCYECKGVDATYRCTECFNCPLLCQACIASVHKWNPLHRIQHWTGTFFERTTLYDIGHVCFLGHHGRPCPTAESTKSSGKRTLLTVVHTTGLHTMNVAYCTCPTDSAGSPENYAHQLWRSGLWPATFVRPQTVFTCHVLRQFHHLTLQSKLTAHDFYATLRRMTNNAFFYDVKVSAAFFISVSIESDPACAGLLP